MTLPVLCDLRAWISTDTISSRFYRADTTFNGVVDHATIIGYNLTDFGQIENATYSALMIGMEPDFYDGVTHVLEYHVNMAVPGGSFVRPYASYMSITGVNAGKITDNNIYSDLNINLLSKNVNIQAAACYTLGASIHMRSLDTGGKDWWLFSSGSGAGKGAGHYVAYNLTNSRYGLVLDALGSVLLGDAAAIATNATDGFVYIPTCAGTPTGVPAAKTGLAPLVVDTTNNKLYFYSGGAWRDTGP